ncbi:phosphatidylinositol-specific phospholipase C/glycerophosphodiester phosphodiesterase family protein [Paracoccus caeni]|uniref:Altered inheritance of mitochondria protein 6 n=1 Tax=Paracoccus caeni TaxID=657651 RepID=A0A934SPP3_9RHOB|nr:phosphatidylinositol-specific phospholipase C/glycerophosphodiester phosphodiesterase family protein [Paracoccus caeni]MBK4218158.1 phosphatidylinositol-specific phospholipase C/glycerophosphodiester phosphodiesterase family protein [Paracoccus caeni]
MLRFAIAATAAMIGGSVWADDVQPLAQAHAHNDYEHERPLLDALDHGFTSVEADIWLVDGELLVAHDEDEITAGKTLQSLYLDPLRQRVGDNDGWVYASGKDMPITLLIDIKSEGVSTYEALDGVLQGYEDILTVFRDGEAEPGAVTAIISGDRPQEVMEQQQVRYAGYDGRMTDLESDMPAAFMPLLSDNWTKVFTWTGEGEMPADERAKLDEIVATVHDKGWKLRFWATPDEAGPARDAIWTVLRDAGVDHINTDDLAALQSFLQDSAN